MIDPSRVGSRTSKSLRYYRKIETSYGSGRTVVSHWIPLKNEILALHRLGIHNLKRWKLSGNPSCQNSVLLLGEKHITKPPVLLRNFNSVSSNLTHQNGKNLVLNTQKELGAHILASDSTIVYYFQARDELLTPTHIRDTAHSIFRAHNRFLHFPCYWIDHWFGKWWFPATSSSGTARYLFEWVKPV